MNEKEARETVAYPPGFTVEEVRRAEGYLEGLAAERKRSEGLVEALDEICAEVMPRGLVTRIPKFIAKEALAKWEKEK